MSFIVVCYIYIYIFKSVELSDQLMLPHHPAVQLSFDGSSDQQQQNRLSREFRESRLSRWGGKSQIGKHQKLSKTRERAAKISSRTQASCFVKLWTCNELTRSTLFKTRLSLSLHLVGWVWVKNKWWSFQGLLWKPFVIRPHRGSILGGEGNLFNSWHSFEFSVTLSNFIKGQTFSIFPENLFLLPPDSFGNFLNICKNKTHFLQPPAAETFSSQSSRDFPDNQQLVRV